MRVRAWELKGSRAQAPSRAEMYRRILDHRLEKGAIKQLFAFGANWFEVAFQTRAILMDFLRKARAQRPRKLDLWVFDYGPGTITITRVPTDFPEDTLSAELSRVGGVAFPKKSQREAEISPDGSTYDLGLRKYYLPGPIFGRMTPLPDYLEFGPELKFFVHHREVKPLCPDCGHQGNFHTTECPTSQAFSPQGPRDDLAVEATSQGRLARTSGRPLGEPRAEVRQEEEGEREKQERRKEERERTERERTKQRQAAILAREEAGRQKADEWRKRMGGSRRGKRSREGGAPVPTRPPDHTPPSKRTPIPTEGISTSNHFLILAPESADERRSSVMSDLELSSSTDSEDNSSPPEHAIFPSPKLPSHSGDTSKGGQKIPPTSQAGPSSKGTPAYQNARPPSQTATTSHPTHAYMDENFIDTAKKLKKLAENPNHLEIVNSGMQAHIIMNKAGIDRVPLTQQTDLHSTPKRNKMKILPSTSPPASPSTLTFNDKRKMFEKTQESPDLIPGTQNDTSYDQDPLEQLDQNNYPELIADEVFVDEGGDTPPPAEGDKKTPDANKTDTQEKNTLNTQNNEQKTDEIDKANDTEIQTEIIAATQAFTLDTNSQETTNQTIEQIPSQSPPSPEQTPSIETTDTTGSSVQELVIDESVTIDDINSQDPTEGDKAPPATPPAPATPHAPATPPAPPYPVITFKKTPSTTHKKRQHSPTDDLPPKKVHVLSGARASSHGGTTELSREEWVKMGNCTRCSSPLKALDETYMRAFRGDTGGDRKGKKQDLTLHHCPQCEVIFVECKTKKCLYKHDLGTNWEKKLSEEFFHCEGCKIFWFLCSCKNDQKILLSCKDTKTRHTCPKCKKCKLFDQEEFPALSKNTSRSPPFANEKTPGPSKKRPEKPEQAQG